MSMESPVLAAQSEAYERKERSRRAEPARGWPLPPGESGWPLALIDREGSVLALARPWQDQISGAAASLQRVLVGA